MKCLAVSLGFACAVFAARASESAWDYRDHVFEKLSQGRIAVRAPKTPNTYVLASN